jgi:hypothetical protein
MANYKKTSNFKWIYVGYINASTIISIPNNFLTSNHEYISNEGLPITPDSYVISYDENLPFPYTTNQTIFFLDKNLVTQFNIDHLKRINILNTNELPDVLPDELQNDLSEEIPNDLADEPCT